MAKSGEEPQQPAFGILFICTLLAVTGVKLLLIPTYHSTDFEVHRNWLAITYSLPISKWYYENSSIWTLDYPPGFAWFEYGMSQVAVHVDPEIVRLDNHDYSAPSVVIFQRLTVIISELVLMSGVYTWAKNRSHPTKQAWSIVLLTLLSPGLFIVDHMHFQYNGFLFGILVWSIIAFQNGNFLMSAFLFALLLNMKHIFLYCVPAFTLALFKYHCFSTINPVTGRVQLNSFSLKKFVSLGLVTVAVFAASLGPFIGHLPQLLSRLFPFQRGLVHAYWAPNAWALYALVDKMAQRLVGDPTSNAVGSMTGGLVGEQGFAVLPQITPKITFVTTIAFTLPGLVLFWMKSTRRSDLVRLVVFSSLVSFYFGWHVHEKAICMVLIPMGLFFAVQSSTTELRSFSILALGGYYSLFPLIFTEAEYPIKAIILLIYLITIMVVALWNQISRPFVSSWFFGLISLVFVAIELFPLMLASIHKRLPFLQLMATSVTTSLVILFGSLLFVKAIVFGQQQETEKPKSSSITTGTMETRSSSAKKKVN